MTRPSSALSTRHSPTRPTSLALIALGALTVFGCSSHSDAGTAPAQVDVMGVAKCRQYLSDYGACIHRLTASDALVEGRIAQARTGLERLPTIDAAEKACAEASNQLAASCR